jgi:TonB family protein
MKNLIAFIGIFLGLHAVAQQKDFLNEELQKQQEEIGAAYVRVSEKKGDVYDVNINFIGGQLFMTGQYADDKLTIPHGHFTYYLLDGNKESEGDYFQGNKVGVWRRWDTNGGPLPDRKYHDAPEDGGNKAKEDSNKSNQPASFTDFNKYVQKNLKYPEKAIQAGTKGTVYVSFQVQKDGSIKNAKVTKGVSNELDAAAMQLIMGMPKWTPAQKNGAAIEADVIVPITFE